MTLSKSKHEAFRFWSTNANRTLPFLSFSLEEEEEEEERSARRREKSGYLQWRSRSSYEKTGNSNRPIAAMNMDVGYIEEGEGARKTRRGEIFVMQIPRQYFFFINIENVFFPRGCIALKRGALFPPSPSPFSSSPVAGLILDIKRTTSNPISVCLHGKQIGLGPLTGTRESITWEGRREGYSPWQPCAIFLSALTINPVKIRSKKWRNLWALSKGLVRNVIFPCKQWNVTWNGRRYNHER